MEKYIPQIEKMITDATKGTRYEKADRLLSAVINRPIDYKVVIETASSLLNGAKSSRPILADIIEEAKSMIKPEQPSLSFSEPLNPAMLVLPEQPKEELFPKTEITKLILEAIEENKGKIAEAIKQIASQAIDIKPLEIGGTKIELVVNGKKYVPADNVDEIVRRKVVQVAQEAAQRCLANVP